MVHAGAYPIYLARMPADQHFPEVPQGIDSAMKALRKLSSKSEEGAEPWGWVPGGGQGTLRMFLISRSRVQAAVYR